MIGNASKPAAPIAAAVPVLTRSQAIARLRKALGRFTDSETSMCKAAADRGIFCQGFRRYNDEELRKCYAWIIGKRPDMTRAELERVANDWQLAQQEVYELPLACDVQQKVHNTCRGWNEFTNDQIARFYYQLTGQEITIV